MADYNIYIHSMEGGVGGSQNGAPTFNPTAPWESEGSQQGGETIANPNFKSPASIAQDSYSLFKTAGAGKVAAAIAVAYAAVKVTYQVFKTYDSFISVETGDYRNSIAISNYEATKNAIFHPVHAVINRARTSQQDRLATQRARLSLELLGDSEINSYINKGV